MEAVLSTRALSPWVNPLQLGGSEPALFSGESGLQVDMLDLGAGWLTSVSSISQSHCLPSLPVLELGERHKNTTLANDALCRELAHLLSDS